MIASVKGERGIALILTILVVSLIVALTIQFNTSMRSDLHAAANLSDGVDLRCIARSGFNLACAALYEDRASGSVDTLQDTWAQTEIVSESSVSLFDEGRFFVDIADLSGRIQINQLVDENGGYNQAQKQLLMRFLSFPEFGLDPDEVENIVDAIKDWIDRDNETTRFGAEDSYYQTLKNPYPCKNAPFEFPEELILVRGITRELYYGSYEKPGIVRYLSTEGDGRVNINTADSLVIRALSEDIDQDLADNMVAYREDRDNDLSDSKWYKRVSGMVDVSIPESLVTTSSSFFEITSDGNKGTMKKRIKGVVERKEGRLRILSFKVD